MSSHVSTEQCHYDKNHISTACYVISGGEIMLYIRLSVAVIMEKEEDLSPSFPCK